VAARTRRALSAHAHARAFGDGVPQPDRLGRAGGAARDGERAQPRRGRLARRERRTQSRALRVRRRRGQRDGQLSAPRRGAPSDSAHRRSADAAARAVERGLAARRLRVVRADLLLRRQRLHPRAARR
jgi:hypothetical protein